jgi:beta-lactamase regulating signal transducer with metallopeptidase domain
MGLFEVTGMWMLAIGKTTIHSIWIGLLILALLRLVQAYIPVRLSGLRYGISVSALLLLFFSVIAAFLMLYEPVSPKQDAFSSSGALPLISGKLFIKNNGEAAFNTSLICALFGYIYVAGILLMLFRSVASLTYIRGLKSSGTQPGPDWQNRFSGICKSLGIIRSVNFLESTRAKGPLLVGYLKPAVIVPAGMLSMLPVSQIETILMHELYHLKRRDYLVNIMQLFIEGVLFYHPVVWIISGYIRTEREHCCDDRVLNSTDNPVNYAKALIHIAEQQQFIRLTPGAVGSAKHQFYSRIKRILNHNTMKTNMRDKVLSFALLAGSVILLLTVSGFSEGASFIRMDKMNSEMIAEPIDPPVMTTMDTIPQKNKSSELEEVEEIDWEAMKVEVETAHQEALEEIEEIDWEAMKVEVETARKEVEEIDWEEIKAEMELSFSEMKLDMEEIKKEIENSMNEIDWDEIREEIKVDLEKSKLFLDSIKIEMDL